MATEIFGLTKGVPPEEKYALTSQIRRSSRSICINFREATDPALLAAWRFN